MDCHHIVARIRVAEVNLDAFKLISDDAFQKINLTSNRVARDVATFYGQQVKPFCMIPHQVGEKYGMANLREINGRKFFHVESNGKHFFAEVNPNNCFGQGLAFGNLYKRITEHQNRLQNAP